MSFPCPELNKDNTEKNEFKLRCANDVFKTIFYRWDNINEKYLNHINKINDPILKYLSLYFVQYYMNGYKYYHDSIKHHRDSACGYLNGWLQEKKDLFTFGKKCNTNLNLWNDNIKTLWDMLLNDSNFFVKYNKPWCNNYNMSIETTFPEKLTLPKGEEIIPQEPSNNVLNLPSEQTKFSCPPCEISAISPQTDHPPDIQPTRKIAVTSGLATAGTVGTLLLLYKYTPVSSWFRRRGMNNIGSDLYMNPGSPDGFLRMQHDNGGNNIFYQP